MTEKLLPCVCGSERPMYKFVEDPSFPTWFVRCAFGIRDCMAKTAHCDTKEQAAAAWNAMQATLHGWTNEIPTEVGDYLFKGEIRDYAGRLCGLNVVYFVRASVKSYSKEPQFVFYPQEFFGDTKELEEHTKGHWLRIRYPEPPKSEA